MTDKGKEMWGNFGIAMAILIMGPFLLIIGIAAAASCLVTIYIAMPYILIAGVIWLIWRANKKKRDKPPVKPKNKPGKPYKPMMMTWKGQKIPMGVFALSIMATLILMPILLVALLFLIPWWALILLIILVIVIKRVKKDKK